MNRTEEEGNVKKRILVVDDELEICRLSKFKLRSEPERRP